MYLQGNLQQVFDALYNLGVIDPVLEMDWTEAMDDFHCHSDDFSEIVSVANTHQEDLSSLMERLQEFDQKTLGYLAMEVAREYADFHSRDDVH